MAGLILLAAVTGAAAQTITSPATAKTILPWNDYATRVLRDPWDMKERTDIGWFTWGVDLPGSNMTGKRMTTDAFGQTIFSGTPLASLADPSIFLLDSHSPGVALHGKIGASVPIDTTQYTRLLVKMRVGNEIKPPQFPQIGTVPVMQVYWSRDTIYTDATLRPTGGTYLLVDGAGNQVGLPFTPLATDPGGAMEGGRYVIYSIPLGSISGLQAMMPSIAKWKNINANNPAVDINWGAPGVMADSLRFKPANLNGAQLGAVDIDWVRLVAPAADPAESITWSGGGAYDIVVSTASDCGASNGDYAVLAYNKTSGFQFQPQMLPNGRYFVALRDRITSGGNDTVSTRQIRACSAGAGGSYTVIDQPVFAFTSPNPTGSADDFATVFLNNPWDFQTDADIDATSNITSMWRATVPAERTDGTSLGNVPVLFGQSAAATPATGPVGDPFMHLLYWTGRGFNNRIDTTRYRLFTADVGVDRPRDLLLGSVFRVVWHIAGENFSSGGGTYDAATVTTDIPLRHMGRGAQSVDGESSRFVLDSLRLDLADRVRVPIEPSPSGVLSQTGWKNTPMHCLAPGGCTQQRLQPFNREGVDNFRLDFHEFSDPTNFFIRAAKLAAHEKTGAAFNIAWTYALPAVPTTGTYATAANWKVRLYAVRTRPETSPGAGNGSPSSPITRVCSSNPGVDTFQIAEPTLAAGSYVWNAGSPGGLVDGALYFICAGLIMPGQTTPSVFSLSEWPVIYRPSASAAPAPRLVVDRTTVRLSARHTGNNQPPNLSAKTPPQLISIAQVGGSSPVPWIVDACVNYDPQNPPTCSGSVDFIQLSATSGSGSGSFTVQIKDSALLPLATGATDIGVILRIREVIAGATSNSPQYSQVFITIYPPGQATSFPFGQVDTPTQGLAGAQGLLGVSGWAIDDVGVIAVRIYRNCLTASEPAACQTNIVPGAPGTPVTYLGDAAFVPGARPDLEAAFPMSPGVNQAGWGYGILSNMLPRMSGPFAPNGGQGPVTLYVIAIDAEGNGTLLGRTWTGDHTPTQVSLNNDAIAKPFGVIDTPTQGGGAAGVFANFGWAITPDNGSGAMIGTSGSTMIVYVDGVPLGNVTYNQCRGTVGNPVPTGIYCNDDVSNIFGNASVQPPFTTRLSNPSRFLNLSSKRGPQGSFTLDTRGYSNGLHAIAWGVTDSAGRVEGIGARNFVVANGTARPADEDGPITVSLSNPLGRDVGARVEDLAAIAPVAAQIGVRQGWALDAPFVGGREERGVVQVVTAERQRIEVALPDTLSGSTWEGYELRHGQLAALPVGSFLDTRGRFYWQTVSGHLGDYDFVFIRDSSGLRERVNVRVTVRPEAAPTATAPSVSTPPTKAPPKPPLGGGGGKIIRR